MPIGPPEHKKMKIESSNKVCESKDCSQDQSCQTPVIINEGVTNIEIPTNEVARKASVVKGQPCVSESCTMVNVQQKQLILNSDIKLREYQEELAAPGLQGKNYIFVAPTGTGKTLVAGYIIMHHLNKMLREGRKGKVAFLTPTRQLSVQQMKALQHYIPGVGVIDVSGSSGRHIHKCCLTNSVIVCTAGKLRQELKTKAVLITDFSLIIADECHHAGRPSNYTDVMEFYIRLKHQDPSAQLPQVIGMTASPGAGKAKNPSLETAKKHQTELCATLDATGGIIVVQKNIHELRCHHNTPTTYQVDMKRDNCDPFFCCMYSTMEKLEKLIFEKAIIPTRGSSEYESYLQREKEAAERQVVDESKKISTCD